MNIDLTINMSKNQRILFLVQFAPKDVKISNEHKTQEE